MAGRKRHSAEDIVRKLRRADELAAAGKTGEEIAAELLSVNHALAREHPFRTGLDDVMTCYRCWTRATPPNTLPSAAPRPATP